MHPHGHLIDRYLAHLAAERRSARTIETYGRILRHAHRQLPYGLPVADDRELVAWLTNPGWSPRTQALYSAAIKSFFRWAFRHQVIEGHDPTRLLPVPRIPFDLPNPATPEQVRAILTRARMYPHPYRLWAAIAAYSGARCIEIAHLDRDRDITDRGIRLHGKGARDRVVPLHPHLRAMIAGHRGPIATTSERQLSNSARHHFRRIGVATSMHRLRSYFATTLLDQGVDVRMVQELLGHASIATTQVYTLVTPRQLNAAVARLPVVEDVAGASTIRLP